MSNLFLFSFAANDSLSFHLLGIVNAAQVHFWGGGGVGMFSMICWFLKCSGIGTTTWYHVSHFVISGHFEFYPSMLWSLIYHQWHIRDALLILPYSFCRVLYNGLFGFSLVLLHCSLIFRITDYEANEAHFQRLLCKHWLAFTCWSFLPYRVVCSCFYFGVLPLAIL